MNTSDTDMQSGPTGSGRTGEESSSVGAAERRLEERLDPSVTAGVGACHALSLKTVPAHVSQRTFALMELSGFPVCPSVIPSSLARLSSFLCRSFLNLAARVLISSLKT